MPAASSRAAARSLAAIVIETAVSADAAIAEHVVRDAQQQRRIDAAREADQRGPVAGDDLAQPLVLVGERQFGGAGGGHRRTTELYASIRSLPATAAAISAATSSCASTLSASCGARACRGMAGTNSEQQSS